MTHNHPHDFTKTRNYIVESRNSFDYLAKVVTGIKFKDGIEVTAVDQAAA